MKAARILKPESLTMGNPHCLILLPEDYRTYCLYYYFEPTSIVDEYIRYKYWEGGDKEHRGNDLSYSMFSDGSYLFYKVNGDFPKMFYKNLSELPSEVARAFHL